MSEERKIKNSYTTRNKVSLIRAGREYFTMVVQLINAAKHSIHLQIYIYDDDETGMMIGEALMKAARRNVQVYFIADGYASRGMSVAFIAQLREAGIHFRFFEPLFKSQHFYFGRRLHHKVLVIDAKYALVGGINITNRYNDFPGSPSWMDYALYVEGEASAQLFQLCNDMWDIRGEKKLALPADMEEFLKSISVKEYCSVRLRVNDWIRYKNQVWRSYFELFNHANRSIIIMCSYFLPGWELLKRLSAATKRGVQIKIILAGPCDVKISKNAERFLYSWMLKRDIQIYEYQPNVLHAKIAVTDGHWVTIGSYNINNISAHASIELNLDVRNRLFAQKMQRQMEQIIEQDCIRITAENYKQTAGFIERFWQKMSYFFIKIVLNLFTFYFKRKKK